MLVNGGFVLGNGDFMLDCFNRKINMGDYRDVGNKIFSNMVGYRDVAKNQFFQHG